MTNREQPIQEIEQAPDELVQTVLNFLHRAKAVRKNHPLAQFAGILTDAEAEALEQTIIADCRQVAKDDESQQMISGSLLNGYNRVGIGDAG